MNFTKMKKFAGKHKKGIAIALLIVVVAVAVISRSDGSYAGYSETEVALRDICTYRSFSGNIEAVTDTPVITKVTAQVTELLVEEGDEVEEGTVLAVLDSGSVEDSIELKDASLKASKTSNAYSVSDAQRSYDDYKYALDSGLNSSLVSAQQSVDSAGAALDDAEEDYDETEAAIDEGTYSATMSEYQAMQTTDAARQAAQSEYDAAAGAFESAKASYDAAAAAFDAAKTAYESNEDENSAADLEAALSAAQTELDAAGTAMETAQKAAEEKQGSLSAAEAEYDSTRSVWKSAKSAALDSRQSAIDSAQTALENAEKNYEVVELQVNQQLNGYAAALEESKATTSSKTSEIELEQLEESLDDYTIVAPCAGTVTQSVLTEGGMATSGTTAFTITGLDMLKVSIDVDEYSILDMKEGSDVTIYVDSIDRTYEGTLTYVADVAQLNNGVSYFEAAVNFEADEYVKSGMSVEVRLVSADVKDVVAVPSDAVGYFEDNTAYVLVKDEKGGQEQRPVTTGVSDGSYTEITEGLSEGETVFVSSRGEALLNTVNEVRGSRLQDSEE